MKKMLWSLLLVCVAGQADESASGRIEVSVLNVEKVKGRLVVSVYNKPDFWLDSDPVELPYRNVIQSVLSLEGNVIVVDEVPKGIYAISVFHDINSNEKIDKNFIGYPKEPFGFSAPMGKFGPPKYEAASIEVTDTVHRVTVELN